MSLMDRQTLNNSMAPYWVWSFLCMMQDLGLDGHDRVLRWGMAMQIMDRYGYDYPRPRLVPLDQVPVPSTITPASGVSP